MTFEIQDELIQKIARAEVAELEMRKERDRLAAEHTASKDGSKRNEISKRYSLLSAKLNKAERDMASARNEVQRRFLESFSAAIESAK